MNLSTLSHYYTNTPQAKQGADTKTAILSRLIYWYKYFIPEINKCLSGRLRTGTKALVR